MPPMPQHDLDALYTSIDVHASAETESFARKL